MVKYYVKSNDLARRERIMKSINYILLNRLKFNKQSHYDKRFLNRHNINFWKIGVFIFLGEIGEYLLPFDLIRMMVRIVKLKTPSVIVLLATSLTLPISIIELAFINRTILSW